MFPGRQRVTAVYSYQKGTCSQNMLRACQVPGTVLSEQHQAELNKSPCPHAAGGIVRKAKYLSGSDTYNLAGKAPEAMGAVLSDCGQVLLWTSYPTRNLKQRPNPANVTPG